MGSGFFIIEKYRIISMFRMIISMKVRYEIKASKIST